MKLKFLLNETFAASEDWFLVEKGGLNQPEQNALAGLLSNENIFGIFKPAASRPHLNPKLAYKEVALLFYYLQQPAILPAFVKDVYDDDMNALLAKLVADEVLKIKINDGFVCGTAATEWLFNENNQYHASGNQFISNLSGRAIMYALQLKNAGQDLITAALYAYNTMPVVAEERVTDAERLLGIGFNTTLEKELLKDWIKFQPTKEYKWLMWNRRNTTAMDTSKSSVYKLYVSPLLKDLPEVFERATRLLSSTGARGFKTGSDHFGLARPDKFVIYFTTYHDMVNAADVLKTELHQYPAQGVPFTAQLDENGLLSWGIDPPKEEVLQQWEGGSWRAQIAEKIASAIVQAKSNNAGTAEAMHYINQKMLLERINPFTWTPEITIETHN